MAKFYAVRKGHIPGVYNSWDECKQQVNGFPGAEYKSFTNPNDANNYLNGDVVKKSDFEIPTIPNNGCLAYVDGSYSSEKKLYAYGVVMYINGEEIHCCKCDNKEHAVEMNNVAGELAGTMRACQMAFKGKKSEIIIVHDYEGIAKWVDEDKPWKANLKATQEYQQFIASMRKYLKITFVWTRGHIGVEGNEMADKLAKQAVENEFFIEHISVYKNS